MTLRFGLIPTGQPAQGAAFAATVGAALGAPVEVHHAADYRGLVAALENGLVHMAWVPPIAAARAIRSGAISPIVVALRNGTTSYSACLFSMRDHPLAQAAQTPSEHLQLPLRPSERPLERTNERASERPPASRPSERAMPAVRATVDLSRLRDLRAGWVDRESASGFIVIRAALRAAGLSLVSAFREDLFFRSHADVARAVKSGRVDVGATFFSHETATRAIARAGWREGGLSDEDVHVVAQAGPIPADLFVAHATVSRAHLTLLQNALIDARPRALHLAAQEMVHADGFVRPSEDHLTLLRDLLATIDAPTSPSVRPPPM